MVYKNKKFAFANEMKEVKLIKEYNILPGFLVSFTILLVIFKIVNTRKEEIIFI